MNNSHETNSEYLLDVAMSCTGNILKQPAWTSIISILLVVILYEFWFRNTHGYKMLRNIPGPPLLPLIGNGHLVIGLSNTEIMQAALTFLRKYGETQRGIMGHKLLVFLTNPADVEIILGSQSHLEKAEEYRYFKPWFGNGLLISKGDHWRYHRKMIAPTFHQSILKSFVPSFVQYSQLLAQRLTDKVGKEFDVHEYMSQSAVEILLSTVMGVRKLPEGNVCLNYAKAVLEMCDIIHKRQVKIMYRTNVLYQMTSLREKGDRLLKIIKSLTRSVVQGHYEHYQVGKVGVVEAETTMGQEQILRKKKVGLRDDLDEIDESDGIKRRLALLDTMVELSKQPECNWNEQDVLDEVNTIMFEGHDTTAAGSSFVLCLLGIHKQVQQQVYEEQQRIFGSNMQRVCTYADTIEMHCLERVIKETLRLYPPVPVIARKVTEDVKLASGPYTIPRGATVVVCQYAMHRRADLYENPEQFDPDNFLPERVSKRHYYSYVPFSAGPRSCVGRKYAMLMLKVLLSTLLRKFTVHSVHSSEADFKLQGDIILKLANGFQILLEPRD